MSEKKGIQEWKERISPDEEFAKKFEGLEDSEMMELAKKEGYNFTEDEFMDLKMESVSGGLGLLGAYALYKLFK